MECFQHLISSIKSNLKYSSILFGAEDDIDFMKTPLECTRIEIGENLSARYLLKIAANESVTDDILVEILNADWIDRDILTAIRLMIELREPARAAYRNHHTIFE